MNCNLKEAILENPDLELVPFCSDDFINPDYGWTMGNIAKITIDEWAVSNLNKERILIKNWDYDDYQDRYLFTNQKATDEEIKIAYEGLQWTKAIILWVDAL